MATTQNTFTGDGSNLGPFSFTFKWLESTDIKVTVAGVLKTAGTHYNLQSLNYATKTGGQVLFTAGNAPANGAAIVIYRQTDDSDLTATFYSGSAIRAQDLNNNFTQNLYVTQESSNNATTATTTANTATTTANTALSNSTTAISTANSAVSTANTASSNASAAVSTANTANSNASTALSTANTANTNASAAVATANTASSNASTALSTANTASSNASTALSTANTALSTANAASATATTASTNATTAISTANTALSTANTANSNATAALNAVASTVQYQLVANVAAIPSTPANGDAVEVANSTGIESFTPLANIPAGFVGDSGLSVRMQYTSVGSTWNWLNYFAIDSETRYLRTGTGTVTSTNIVDGTIVNADINASAAIAGTKISPDFGSQNVVTTGNITVNAQGDVRFADADSSNWVAFQGPATVSSNVTWTLPSADGTSGQVLSTNGTGTLSWSTASAGATDKIEEGNTSAEVIDTGSDGRFVVTTEGSERLRVDSSGRLGLGTSSPSQTLHVAGAALANGFVVPSTTGYFYDVTGQNGFYIYGSTNGSTPNILSLNTTGTERLRIDSSGRVGIGTTAPGATLEVGAVGGNVTAGDLTVSTASTSSVVTVGRLSSTSNDNTTFRVRNRGGSTIFEASPTAITFGPTGTEAARIDSSSRLLVGTSSARDLGTAGVHKLQVEGLNENLSSAAFIANVNSSAGPYLTLAKSRGTSNGSGTVVSSGDQLGSIQFNGADGTDIQTSAARIACEVDGTPGANDMPGRLVFSTTADGASSPTERMRIGNNGILYSVSTSVGYSCVTTVGAGTSTELFEGKYGATAGSIASGTQSFRVWTNGNVQNTNNSYTAISDLKLKENIVNAGSQWADIKALQVRNYNLKEGQTHRQIGLIAQEVEPISPGLVYESPDRDTDGNELGTVTKSVNYSVLYMKAVKALQEAMERIEQLETEMAEVKAQLQAS